MSMSKEHYLAQLVVLRRLRCDLTRVHLICQTTPTHCIEDEMHRCGMVEGIETSAEYLMEHIKDAQYLLRRICGVPKQIDLIFGR